MTSADAMFAIIFGTAGLVDVMEGDTRLNAQQKLRLTEIKTYAVGNATTRDMDQYVVATLQELMNKVRAYG
jgi:hypothetical protein